MWYDFQNRCENQGLLGAEVRVPAESRWFDGHFPGYPVLPGIAQLAMVFDVIQGALAAPARVLEVGRVRFKQMIRPEDQLQVWAEPRPGREGAYSFRITKNEEVVCSGTMIVKHIQ
jgi:3-hydroxymyristoyl/3-hydroxydecanoyl-(acyl carrier protein) dehydratase